MSPEELGKLLEAARRAHESRREYGRRRPTAGHRDGGARRGRRARRSSWRSWRACGTKSCSTTRGRARPTSVLTALRPGTPRRRGDGAGGREAREVAGARGALRQEARQAADPAFRSSLLVSGRRGDVPVRARRGGRGGREPNRGAARARRSRLDPKNRRAEMLLERVLRAAGRWDDLARPSTRFADESSQKDEKVAAWLRLARVFTKKLEVARARGGGLRARARSRRRASQEATSFLADHFTSREMWEHLVALYEGQLSDGRAPRPGRGVRRDAADRDGALADARQARGGRAVVRARCASSSPRTRGCSRSSASGAAARGESARLATVLTEAQRAHAPTGRSGRRLVAEIAKLAEEGANAQKAIEQWRTLLRQDPRTRTRATR